MMVGGRFAAPCCVAMSWAGWCSVDWYLSTDIVILSPLAVACPSMASTTRVAARSLFRRRKGVCRGLQCVTKSW